jgi:hypothetical protein
MKGNESLDRLAFYLLETNLEIQRLVYAHLDGYGGFVPLNTVKELDDLIKQAKVLRKRMMLVRPKGFERYFK